jgi:hypothetical protein
MTAITLDKVRIGFDVFCDFIPLVSTLTNTIDLVRKKFLPYSLEPINSSLHKHTYSHYIHQKNTKACWLLLIPIVNIAAALALHCGAFNKEMESKSTTKPAAPITKPIVPATPASVSNKIKKEVFKKQDKIQPKPIQIIPASSQVLSTNDILSTKFKKSPTHNAIIRCRWIFNS